MMKKNLKNVNGGILLEVLFMLGIMVFIFPFIQSNVKKRTDAIRNQMVVKDLIKLKTAVENYLKRKPTFDYIEGTQSTFIDILKNCSEETDDSVKCVSFSELYDSGLEQSFNAKNVLDQEYKIRIKLTTSGLSSQDVVYDAIIIATGNKNIPTVRIRDIVKESKGYAGYVEKEGGKYMVYGPNWQLNASSYGDEFVTPDSIVVKVGFSKKDYKYISRKAGIGSNTMETDLFMNLNSINNIRNLKVYKSVEVGEFKLGSSGDGILNLNNVIVADNSENKESDTEDDIYENTAKVAVQANMNIAGSIIFSNGLNMSDLSYNDDTKTVKLSGFLNIQKDLFFDTDSRFCYNFLSDDEVSNCNRLRKIKSNTVDLSGDTNLYISNLFKFAYNPERVLNVNYLTVSSMDIEKEVSDGVGLKFNKMFVDGYETRYNVNESGASVSIGMNDVIVRDVNSKLLGKTKKIGGIDITDKTPLTVILRALYYEYADIHKVISNFYPLQDSASKGFFLPWFMNLYRRCEYETCLEDGWHK